MTDKPASAAFPVPYAASQELTWREVAAALRNNGLSGFPPRAFDEPVVRRSFVGRQQIILSDPAAIRHILIENPENYRRTPSVARLLGPVVGNGLFLAKGDDWRRQRRAAAAAFVPRMMPPVAMHVARASERLIGRLAAQEGQPVELFSRLQLLALEVAAAVFLSLDITAEAPAFRAEMQRYSTGIGRPTLLDFMMPHGCPTPRSWVRWRFRRAWMRRIAGLLAARRANRSADATADLCDMMAAGGATGAALVEQAATMLTAGHETTGVALSWAAYLVASLPELQERLAAEAASLDLSPGGAAAALPRLVYTRAVIDEVLRLFPPAFSIVRQARASDDAAGVAIPARAAVLIVPWVLHRHRRLWRDPDIFEAERFLPGAAPPERFSYLPFGAGPRACIGAQFALTESVLVLARLVQAFRIELADDRPILPVATVILQPDRSPLFRLRPRAASR